VDEAERHRKSAGKFLETVLPTPLEGIIWPKRPDPCRKRKSMAVREMVPPLRSTAPGLAELYPLSLFFARRTSIINIGRL
jgi:hypothetical protein